jgi:hypothetical protein
MFFATEEIALIVLGIRHDEIEPCDLAITLRHVTPQDQDGALFHRAQRRRRMTPRVQE